MRGGGGGRGANGKQCLMGDLGGGDGGGGVSGGGLANVDCHVSTEVSTAASCQGELHTLARLNEAGLSWGGTQCGWKGCDISE